MRSVPEASRANNLGGLNASSRPNAVKQRSRLTLTEQTLERRGVGVAKGRAPEAPTPLSSSSAPFRPSEPRMLLRHRTASLQDRVKPLTASWPDWSFGDFAAVVVRLGTCRSFETVAFRTLRPSVSEPPKPISTMVRSCQGEQRPGNRRTILLNA